VCPKDKPTDLATFYQNRAAAYDQLEDVVSVLSDCDIALNLNNKYVKALDRRAKALRKQAQKIENFAIQVEKLKQCVEDITSVCLLEGFQKQEHLLLVDQVLRELGRAEAALASKSRTPLLPSNHFISQYLESFAEDPIAKILKKESEGDIDEKENGVEFSAFSRAKQSLLEEKYANIIDDCTEEIEADPNTSTAHLARLLRGTFYALRKQQDMAMEDLTVLIDTGDAVDAKVRVNALIKRASLYIQMCKDPQKDPELALADFGQAVEIDADNSDVYNHRGQVYLLLEEMNKSIVDFNRAVSLNPNHPIAYAQKLYTDYRCAAMIGDVTKVHTVISDFYEAIEKHPKCVENYSLAAQVLNSQEQFKEADALYKKALEVDPHNANLMVHRGLMALQSRGDIEEGVRLIEKALEMDELCEFAYETLGTIEVQKGNLKRAIELYDKAIPLANTELEMAHLFGLKEAATAQITVSQKFGIDLGHRLAM
jgi:import receptor subunit TOM70